MARLSHAAEQTIGKVLSPLVSGVAAFNRWRLPPRDAPHPLLTGVHAPMTEELTLTDLMVEGEIPRELDGRYVRIGPNPAAPDPRTYHFFTGDGMLHGVRISDGRALWYRNRWIRSTEVAAARGLAAAPGPRHIFDTVNTSVFGHAGAGWALVEAGSTPVRFDELLEGQRYDDLAGTLPGSFTAHPRRDPATGELHALCYEATDPKRVRYNVVDVAGRVRRSVIIPVEHGPLIHDCAITERYVVVLDLPLTLSMRVVLAGHGFPYRWNPKHRPRVGLLPREGRTDDMIWLPVEPCFVFHHVNAFDLADGRLVLDVVSYDRMFADENDGPDEQPRGIERWTIDPAAGSVTKATLDASPQELPVIDSRRIGLPYRYAYALGLPETITETLVGEAPLLKHDLERGERQAHLFGSGRLAGEFVFVPRAPEAAEDDGWLMGFVIEADGRSTALEIIDARRFEAPPVATIRLPHRIPPGIHGAWLPTAIWRASPHRPWHRRPVGQRVRANMGMRADRVRAWWWSLCLLASATMAVPVAAAQNETFPSPPVLAVPQAVAAPALPLPELSAAQAQQLAGLIRDDEIAQGLRLDRGPDLTGLDGVSLVRAALDHARAVRAGRLAPEDFQRDWGIMPAAYDPLPGFAAAVRSDRLVAWVKALPPPYQGYDTLAAGLARYRAIAAAGGWPVLSAIPKFGERGPAAAQLRERLAIEDSELVGGGDRFDAALLDAVRRAQRRYGLNPAGQPGAQTLAALNVPVETRIRQIMANMERWRWLPPQLDRRRVQVNIAAAVLTVFEGDAPVMSMKAVTGRPGNETPMLVSRISSIVINPPWNVPSSIADKELWPKERASPGYLKRNGFRVIDTGDGGKRLQQSSERSALGRFKFDFPNAFAVYLHDTPAQSGFSQFDRLSSHGCVRLEKPADLAKLLMKTTSDWQPPAIDAAVAAGKTVRAPLAEPVSVYLLYWTAFATPNAQVGFRDDPYGWDGQLAGRIERRSAVQALAAR